MLLDTSHPFFRPKWRRVAIVVFCLGWALFEFLIGEQAFGIIFAALGIYAGWKFYQMKDPDPSEGPE